MSKETGLRLKNNRYDLPSSKKNSPKKFGVMGCIGIVLIVALILVFFETNSVSATTMRIIGYNGTVTLEEKGKPRTVREQMRLNSGNELATEEKSSVTIGLDDTKIVILEELSRASFSQKRRKLDLDLLKGQLRFSVDKPLEEDEDFNIRTSTMIVGIRGTQGRVFSDNGVNSLIVEQGKVHVIGINPVTGEEKETDVHEGESLTVITHDDRTEDTVEFQITNISEEPIEPAEVEVSEKPVGPTQLRHLRPVKKHNVELGVKTNYIVDNETWMNSFEFVAGSDNSHGDESGYVIYDLDDRYSAMSFRLTPFHGKNNDKFNSGDRAELIILDENDSTVIYDRTIDSSTKVLEDEVDLTGISTMRIEIRVVGGRYANCLLKDVLLYPKDGEY